VLLKSQHRPDERWLVIGDGVNGSVRLKTKVSWTMAVRLSKEVDMSLRARTVRDNASTGSYNQEFLKINDTDNTRTKELNRQNIGICVMQG
jgi:hypothetical protein